MSEERVYECSGCGWRGTEAEHKAMMERPGVIACCPDMKLVAGVNDYCDHGVDVRERLKGEGEGMNERLYEQAEEALRRLYADQSVAKETTAANLTALKIEIETMLDALEV